MIAIFDISRIGFEIHGILPAIFGLIVGLVLIYASIKMRSRRYIVRLCFGIALCIIWIMSYVMIDRHDRGVLTSHLSNGRYETFYGDLKVIYKESDICNGFSVGDEVFCDYGNSYLIGSGFNAKYNSHLYVRVDFYKDNSGVNHVLRLYSQQ